MRGLVHSPALGHAVESLCGIKIGTRQVSGGVGDGSRQPYLIPVLPPFRRDSAEVAPRRYRRAEMLGQDLLGQKLCLFFGLLDRTLHGVHGMARPLTTDRLLLATLRRLIESDSSINQVAERMAYDSGNLSALLKGKKRLNLEVLEQICAALGLPTSLVNLAARKEPLLTMDEAEAALRQCREPRKRYRDPRPPTPAPLFAKLDTELLGWLAQASSERGDSRRRPDILEMEERRFRDPQGVCEEIEVLVSKILEVPPTAAGRADLAVALSMWSSIRRVAGFRADARDACVAALRALRGVDNPFCLGVVLYKASYVLADYEHFQFGSLYLVRASDEFGAVNEQDWQARVFRQRGFFSIMYGSLSEAEKLLKVALIGLSLESRLEQSSTYELLAEVYRRTGRLGLAQRALISAQEFCSDNILQRAYLQWRQAEILGEIHEYEQARRLLGNALSVFCTSGEPLDASLLAVDLAAMTLRAGRTDKFAELANAILNSIDRLGFSRRARRATLVLVNLLLSRSVSLGELEEIQQKLEKEGRLAGRPSVKGRDRNQPPGGKNP